MSDKSIKKFVRRLAALVVAFFISNPMSAAPQLHDYTLSWKNVIVDNNRKAVFCFYKDSRGLIWLGTNNGLYFFDGVTTHPVSENRLVEFQIYSLVEKDDKLYIGSNNGLMIYDYFSGRISQYETSTPKEIRAMLLYDNDLWIGGLNGISKLNLKSKDIEDYSDVLQHEAVYSILRDSRGILYVGTYHGIARWDNQTKSFKRLKIRLENIDNYSLFANCLLENDDNESIYIGGEGHLYKYSPANEQWEEVILLGSNNIKSLSNGGNGHIFIGTDNGVFDLCNDNIKHYRHDSRQELSLANNEIWCMYVDELHNVWAGHERGFSIASITSTLRTIKLSALTHSGEGNEIHSIYRDSKNNLWFGGTNGIIRISFDSTPHWYRHSQTPNSLSHNRVRAIHEDEDSTMWFATDGGLNRYNSDRNSFDLFHVVDSIGEHNSNWIYTLVEDNDYFWIGSFLGGLHHIKKSKFKTKGGTVVADMAINTDSKNHLGISLVNNYVNNVIKDAKGNLWILLFRDNALVKYTPTANKMKKYDIYELVGEYPLMINADNRGRIWCAFKGGVVVFDNDEYKIVRLPYTNSDETALAMGKVGDDMWLSTQSNVWSIDGNLLKSVLLPIPQKPYTAIYEDIVNDKIYLGGTDEILEVDHSVIASSTDYKTIQMVLHDRGDGDLDFLDIKNGIKKIKIPYGGNITLVVSSLHYSSEVVHRYMYKLAESPTDTIDGWIVMPEGSNTITFSDLKMGDYSVLVKIVGSPVSPISIPLTVNPPLALSWWAITLYIIMTLGIIIGSVWFTRKKNIRSLREQERQTALENVERKLSFLSTISHDLKTPLSMILGPVSLMKEKIKDPENKRNLETIYDNAIRLNNMIQRTLELQQLENKDENLLILSVFDVVEFCKGMFEVFKENNPQKNFIFHSSNSKILIEADAVKFESIITNLLSNACKYSDEGATISIGIREENDTVEIVVSDDGVGISDIDQSLVFHRMFRAPATSQLKEGTGLGLYLIKKYLELMGGNINLYSKKGQGTSFIVTLPISEKYIPENQKNKFAEESDKDKVLIVEDNIQISSFIRDILNERYTCLSAENGRSGLAIAASFAPDLVIIDEMMPIMSGLEMVKRMKQNPRLASIPIIMLTAKSDNKTENESIKLGIDVFMIKPFEPYSLLGRINQLLKSRTEIKEHVRIQTIAEAESKPIEAESINEKSLVKIVKIIEDNISDPDLNVNQLCEKSGIPNKQLYRLIKKYMGIPPLDYIRKVRLQKAAILLSQHRFTVSEICYMVGFKTPSYFAKCFQSQYGVKPSQYMSDDETLDKDNK